MLTYGGRGFHPAHPIRFPIEQILLCELLDGEVKYIADAFQLTVGKKGKHPLLLKVPPDVVPDRPRKLLFLPLPQLPLDDILS